MRISTKKVSSTSKTKFNVAHENMLYNVVTFALAAANLTITQSIAALYTLIQSIQTNLQTIDSLRATSRSPLTGYASQKKALRAALTSMSVDIMNAAYSFAIDTNNDVLAKQMLNAATRLQGGYRQFLQYVNGAIQNVTPFVTSGALTPYGVTSGTMTTWQTTATSMSTLMSTPQNAIANRVAINKSIYAMLNECMFMITNNADTLVSQLRASQADYYNNYWANRRLNEHHMSTQLRLYVTNQFRLPVTPGEVFIIGTDRSAPLDLTGYALVDHIPFGMHEISLTTPFGTNTYGPFDFKKGKSLTLHAQISTLPAVAPKITVTEEDVKETASI